MAEYVASIGMEVHAELLTRSKMFCRCPVEFGGDPNTRVCPVCMGLPGALPVPNKHAIELVLRTALALNCQIAMDSIFHRKNYFYPDLPKGYQISQYGETNPLGYNGYLDIPTSNGTKRIHITRVHLEEDTGKLIHLPGGGSGVDYNRSGVPLMEIVTAFPPDITNAEEAKSYLTTLRHILLYLEVCDGKMEEGSLRCEPNISIRQQGHDKFGTKTELKNLNSFRSVQLGSEYEIRRQTAVLEEGGEVLQETRGWNEQRESSFVMRRKETENDYRYFPDPDLVPMRFDQAFTDQIRANLPELPIAKTKRYQEQFQLSEYDAGVLIADKEWAGYFEEAVNLGGDPKAICNLMTNQFAEMLKENGLIPRESKVLPSHIVDLLGQVAKQTISSKMAKDVFLDVFNTGTAPSEIIQAKGLAQITDSSAIETAIADVLRGHAELVEKYRTGQTNVKGFLIGQVMKGMAGKANPAMVQDLIQKALENA
ncbi:MAG TPA: Asp-tRNA(Asn)/Glu-tRNA(Gln) amidotransferase subunit GatB [Fimbriimonadaceae bacterium]|jgi:aspartyl-tRNA(Asn)/glutamyl-tRNA(Gln) amidotransferase subunit B